MLGLSSVYSKSQLLEVGKRQIKRRAEWRREREAVFYVRDETQPRPEGTCRLFSGALSAVAAFPALVKHLRQEGLRRHCAEELETTVFVSG